MPELLNTIPHDFEFIEDNRSAMTLVGSIRLVPDRNVVELKKDINGDYPTTGEHYVIGPLLQPKAVRQWVGLQAFIKHRSNGISNITGDGFRLHDGTNMRYWNGSTWAVAGSGNWNTEIEVAANIATFPVMARKLRVVVRLTTTDARKTPVLSVVRVAWIGKVFPWEDIIYRSLVPQLRACRITSEMMLKVPFPGGATLNVSAAVTSLGVPLNVVDVDGIFNHTTDPDHYTNLLSSYNPGTGIATLSTGIPVGNYALIRLVVQPEVAVHQTSPDYIEVEKAPALQIVDIETVDSHELSHPVGVANKGSGSIIRIPPPYRFNLRFTMIALAPGGVDLTRTVQAIVELLGGQQTITSVMTDEKYRLWLMEEFNNTTRPNGENLHSMQATFMVMGILHFHKPAVTEVAVTDLNLNFS